VVVDESDSVLNTFDDEPALMALFAKARDKGWLNDFLDSTPAKTIWIVNTTRGIAESTRRRFSFSLRFTKQTARQREKVWSEQLRGHVFEPHIGAETIRDLSEEFDVSAGIIASALKASGRCTADAVTPVTAVASLREILTSHMRMQGTPRRREPSLSREYDLSALNTSVPAGTVMSALEARDLAGEWEDGPPVNLLFWGLPGTGKTEFAKYLAYSLRRELLVRRASDLLDMFVGGTEKAIRRAFETAADQRAILLLDEVDSLLIDRQTAVRSWEASQTNELLTQMENHHGILICCTNLLARLDSAAARRFAWKIEFKPLADEMKIPLFARYFRGHGSAMAPSLARRVERIPDLTAGDIKAVWLRFGAIGQNERDLEDAVAALEDEVRYKSARIRVGRIGFR
jgi:hypothetical protein